MSLCYQAARRATARVCPYKDPSFCESPAFFVGADPCGRPASHFIGCPSIPGYRSILNLTTTGGRKAQSISLEAPTFSSWHALRVLGEQAKSTRHPLREMSWARGRPLLLREKLDNWTVFLVM